MIRTFLFYARIKHWPLRTLLSAIGQAIHIWWIGYAPSVEPQGDSPLK